MFTHLAYDNLLALLTAVTALVFISAAWLYLVMRRTRAAKISLRAMGVSVEVDMTRDRRAVERRTREEEDHS